MEGDEGGIFSKTPECKSLFSLKIKIKQSSIFMRINENIEAYPRSEKKK